MSAYSEKLKDPRWQKKRLEILERDSWACQKCFDTESTLHVHHRSYRCGADPWDYDSKLLVTMCESCHTEETESLKNEERALLDTLKMAGADSRELNDLVAALGGIRCKPLGEQEWSILCWHLTKLFNSRKTDSGIWKLASDLFWRSIRTASERLAKEREAKQ